MIQAYHCGLVMHPQWVSRAVLSHVMSEGTERPIAFALRTLPKTDQKYTHIVKEALSIVWGIKMFRVYLSGSSFTLYTDH